MRFTIFQAVFPAGTDAAASRRIGYVEADDLQHALRRLVSESATETLHHGAGFLRREHIELRGNAVIELLARITWYSPIPDPWIATYTAEAAPEGAGRSPAGDLCAPWSPLEWPTPEEEERENDDRAVAYALATWGTYVRNQVKPALRAEWATVTVERLAHRVQLGRERVEAALARLGRSLAV